MHATVDPISSTPGRVKTAISNGRPAAAGGEPLASFLGLFSVGLGLWEMLDPHGVARRTGVPYPGLIRAFGLREFAAGVGILCNRRPAGWLAARVAGDGLDLATLAAAYYQGDEAARAKVLMAAAAVAGVTALDIVAAGEHAAG